jgi:hypothetical protein
MLATLAFAFTDMAEESKVLTPAEQVQVANALEEDAEVMSNSQLDALITEVPPDTEAEILSINSDARSLALQFALLVPLIAGLAGLALSFKMVSLPDIEGASERPSVMGA